MHRSCIRTHKSNHKMRNRPLGRFASQRVGQQPIRLRSVFRLRSTDAMASAARSVASTATYRRRHWMRGDRNGSIVPTRDRAIHLHELGTMHSYKDSNGREWGIRLSTHLVNQVLAKT